MGLPSDHPPLHLDIEPARQLDWSRRSGLLERKTKGPAGEDATSANSRPGLEPDTLLSGLVGEPDQLDGRDPAPAATGRAESFQEFPYSATLTRCSSAKARGWLRVPGACSFATSRARSSTVRSSTSGSISSSRHWLSAM